MASPSTVDAYLADLPADRRSVMEELRATVRAAAPEATEAISYQMPALRLHDRFLVSYAAYKSHYSLFPANEVVVNAVGADLTPFLSGRGTIRFPADKPIPYALVTKVVKARVKEANAAHSAEVS